MIMIMPLKLKNDLNDTPGSWCIHVSHRHLIPVRQKWTTARSEETPEDRLHQRKSTLEEMDRWSDMVVFSWGRGWHGGCTKKTLVSDWKFLFMASYVNMCLCVFVWKCVKAGSSLYACMMRWPFFCACPGHTCISLFACVGCWGLDTLSLLPSYPKEDRTWETHTDTQRQQIWVSSIPPLSSKSSRTMRRN